MLTKYLKREVIPLPLDSSPTQRNFLSSSLQRWWLAPGVEPMSSPIKTLLDLNSRKKNWLCPLTLRTLTTRLLVMGGGGAAHQKTEYYKDKS